MSRMDWTEDTVTSPLRVLGRLAHETQVAGTPVESSPAPGRHSGPLLHIIRGSCPPTTDADLQPRSLMSTAMRGNGIARAPRSCRSSPGWPSWRIGLWGATREPLKRTRASGWNVWRSPKMVPQPLRTIVKLGRAGLLGSHGHRAEIGINLRGSPS